VNPATEKLSLPFDYIVCGAGTAGCVAAARLAENPTLRVLLIEAGGGDESDLVSDPNRWPQALGTHLDWGFKPEASPHLLGRSIPYSMGKVLGGGSSINVSTWSRGHKADWDFYASEADDEAWAYEQVAALYRQSIEAWSGIPDPQYRGAGGKVHVQLAANPHPFAFAVLEAAQSAGIPRYPNANGAMMEADSGCSLVEETVCDGRRRSIFRSYLHPLLTRENLTVLTDATVTRVKFEGSVAISVECRHEGQILTLRATREIVLSLGAINTPKVLMLSGIGNGAELRALGLPVLHDRPGVGQNLHDHIALGCVWETNDQTLPPIPRSQSAIFWKTDSALDAPNFYAYARRGAAITPENAAMYAVPNGTWSFMVGMRSASRGSVHLTGSGATAPIRINTGFLSDPRDLDNLVEGLARVREIGNAAALGAFAKREVVPGLIDVQSWRAFLRRGVGTFWHQCGTARMGLDAMAVVDGRLRVHGIDSLRVADASIMPRVTTGNTMAPCVVIGEQVARFMTGA
jgi:choline dehydrogenase